METARKYDLLAISLLVFSAVLIVWLGFFGPTNTTVWKDWQPLMAAALALGGAGIVYRGATLTYRAAMAKVDLDREIHARERRRKSRGIFLRVALDMHVLAEHADAFKEKLKSRKSYEPNVTISQTELRLWKQDPLDEAWANLDAFPADIAREISRLRVALINFNDSLSRVPASGVEILGGGNLDSADVRDLREAVFHTANIARAIAAKVNLQAFALH